MIGPDAQNDPPLSAETIKKYEVDLAKSKDGLSYFLAAWTVILIGFQTAEFLGSVLTPAGFATAYVVILGAHVAHKEINRWAGIPMKMRSGEVFAYI